MKGEIGFVVPGPAEKVFKKLTPGIELFAGEDVFGCMCN